ncbi:Hpt domain-containing protein [Pannus brasiliensis CCIBt3594]|uniref:histidine kinase n=1 Tax=Pannus brasiliensis CCIBt3594 TaxID=1427578 RepID=A0AAW9QZP1_9CHRO
MNLEIRDQAYQFFIEEASELLQTIETGLLSLQEDRSPARVHEIMRAAHSIKGGAASVGLDAIRTLSHRLEDFFRALYQEGVRWDSELESLLLQGFDCLKNPLLEQIDRGEHDPEAALLTAEPIFQQIQELLAEALVSGADFIPGSADLGIDITRSIFDVDVETELQRVKTVLDGGTGDVAIELRTTIEIFTGFSEMLALPGFGEIGRVVGEKLEKYPDRATEITRIALQDWDNARSAVLAGDRTSGGSPSAELLSFGSESVSHGLDRDFLEQAYHFFIEEATELLQTIERGLQKNGADLAPAEIHELVRAAHSIKGGAASVGLETIRSIAYRLETVFSALGHPGVEFTPELDNALQSGFDCLKTPLLDRIEGREPDEAAALARAESVFSRIEEYLGDAFRHAGDYLPSSSDLGVDIVASIFEVDVAENLTTLETALAGDRTEEIAATLQATLEMFDAFAQMLNLPGFGEICATTRRAIEYHPEQLREIASIARKDFQQARERVLAGDRTAGGTPSAELSILAFPSPQGADLTTSPPLEDVFALAESPISEVPALEDVFALAEAPISEVPALEDVFALAEAPIAEDRSNVFPDEEMIQWGTEDDPIPSLFDLFVDDPSEIDLSPATEGEAIAPPSLEPEESGDFAIPSLEDVFALPPEPDTASADRAIEEIFGSLAISPLENVSIPEIRREEEFIAAESLEEVFGSVEIPAIDDGPRAEIEASIEQAATEIGRDFDRLPLADLLPQIVNSVKSDLDDAPVEAKPKARDEKESAKTTAGSSGSSLTVRVDFNRLERMSNLVGELSINRNSLSLQNEQLQAAVKELLDRFARFEGITNGIRELADRMLLAGDSLLTGLPTGHRDTTTDESDTDIRFDTLEMDRYGHLHSQLQELLEQMMQLGESVDDIVLFARGSNQTLETQRQMLTNLRDELMWARMLPLGEVLNRFPRVLRDLSNSYHKTVRLKLTGTGVLVDKAALEKLYDPLLHLLRNAFDHGIETPDARREKGKPAEGQIEIRAYHQGNQTIIEIKDDGRGLNFERIREKAIASELMTEEQLALLPRDRLAELIFEPGFSTAETVSELSGRGVGLDVVRDQVRALKGTVSVTSMPGKGTIFSLRLPLTLTIAKLLVCTLYADGDRSRSTSIALPSDAIEEILIPREDQIKRSGEQRFVYFGDRLVPIYRLVSLLEYRCPLPETFARKSLIATVPSPEDWGFPLLFLRRGQQMIALEVDRLVTEQELVIKPFGNAIVAPPYTYGCTILGDGTLIPVVNAIILLEYQEEITAPSVSRVIPTRPIETAPAPSIPTILIVDDSAALRRTLAITLQKAGYRVLQARDGREALEQLERTRDVQLIVCDVEMPNMNGFEFLGQRRKSDDLLKIPVAMLTSRGSDKHRQLATHLGANAYFTKPYIEQQFLLAVRDLVASPALLN